MLKRCPFCDSDMSSFAGMTPDAFAKGDADFAVNCECHAVGPFRPTMEEAVSAWNTRGAAQAPPEPTPAQVNSACLSYRHDFGMIGAVERERTQFEAREWLRAWQKEGIGSDAQAAPSRKQIEAVIDDYLGNIDATYEDSRQRCAQAIVDLYAVTSTTLGSAAK